MTLAYLVPILPFTPLYTWVFEMRGEPFSYSRFSQQEETEYQVQVFCSSPDLLIGPVSYILS